MDIIGIEAKNKYMPTENHEIQNTPVINSNASNISNEKPKPNPWLIVMSVLFFLTLFALIAVLVLPSTKSQSPQVAAPTTMPPTKEATPDASLANWKMYENTSAGFSIKYPSEWSLVKKPYEDPEPLFSNKNSFTPLNTPDEIRMSISAYSPNSSVCQSADGCEAPFNKFYAMQPNEKTAGQKGEITKISNLLVDSMPAIKYKNQIGDSAYNLIYEIKSKNYYIFINIFTNNKDNQDNNMSLFDQILSTFKFTGSGASTGEQIQNGKAMGFIKNVYAKSGKNYIDIDIVKWMNGLEGSKACYEDGQCKEVKCLTEECLPNGYYIRNSDSSILTLEVSTTAIIEDLGNDKVGTNPNKISFSTLESNFTSSNPEISWIKTSPYNIEVSGGNVVTRIQQVYRP